MPESEPRLIRGYLQVLAAQLPGPIVEELTDGLTETYRSWIWCTWWGAVTVGDLGA